MTYSTGTLVDGVVVGLQYGLLAVGLVVVYRTSRIINFSQGQIGVTGALFMMKMIHDWHLPYLPSAIAVVALCAAASGITELVLRRLFDRPRVLVTVATIGFAQVWFLVGLMPFVTPKQTGRAFPIPFDVSWSIGSYVLSTPALLTLVVAPAVVVALTVFLRATRYGLALRASADNAESARLAGVWVRRSSTLAWVLAGALSGVAAILNAPSQGFALADALTPDALLRALTGAIIGGLSGLPGALGGGVAVGVGQQFLLANVSRATTELLMFLVLLGALVARAATLRLPARLEERSSWRFASDPGAIREVFRRRIGYVGVAALIGLGVALPLVLPPSQNQLFARVCVFGVIGLSLTVLLGWAGQLSLGHFALVAVGALVTVHLDWPLPFTMLAAGAVAAVVAVLIGLPALRIKGLYLAVSTLGFALLVQAVVVPVECWDIPVTGRRVCTGLPRNAFVARPGWLESQRATAWFALGALVLTAVVLRVWRDHGVARRIIAVRDNETAAAAEGLPVTRAKLLAFALSGFVAGVAGVLYALVQQSLNAATFAPSQSIRVVSMVVIGGLGSIVGAVFGAIYLEGLPALFGSTGTVQFLTSAAGLLVFLLYVPAGMGGVGRSLGDLVAARLRRGATQHDEPVGADDRRDPESVA